MELLDQPTSLAKMGFVEKLQHILATADTAIVSWSPNGQSFFVFDTNRWVGRPTIFFAFPLFPPTTRR